MKSLYFYSFPAGKMGIAEENGAITGVFFRASGKIPADYAKAETPLIKTTAAQIAEYFAGKRKIFDVPLALNGTAFQKSVWNALREIPFGETRSYKDIAARIGNTKACRAVGMANNLNPVAVIVPCHRVIGADGGLTGYAGGLAVKQRLLELERRG